jgi:hypothetical protein
VGVDQPLRRDLLLADPVLYPPLAELAGPMHKLAGLRVDPGSTRSTGATAVSRRGWSGWDGATTTIAIPDGAEVHDVAWTVDGERFALTVAHGPPRPVGRLGRRQGAKIEGVAVNPAAGHRRELAARPEASAGAPDPRPRVPSPPAPAIPAGPAIIEGEGASARSTYEARNLLETAHDDALFTYYTFSELVIVDPRTDGVR